MKQKSTLETGVMRGSAKLAFKGSAGRKITRVALRQVRDAHNTMMRERGRALRAEA